MQCYSKEVISMVGDIMLCLLSDVPSGDADSSDSDDDQYDGRVDWLTVKEPAAGVHINYYGEK